LTFDSPSTSRRTNAARRVAVIVVQRNFKVRSGPLAVFIVRSISHNAIKPGAERGLPTEGVDLSHDRAERVLYDFLGVSGASRDPQGQAISPIAVGAEKFFRRSRLSRGKPVHQLTVTIHPSLLLMIAFSQ